jgi:hypothetical protein
MVTIVLFPLYTIFFQHPSFARLLRFSTTNEVARLASHLSSFLDIELHDIKKDSLSEDAIRQITILMKDPHIVKVKIYALSGETLYSTDREEIGSINDNPYFQRIVTSGTPISKEVPKNSLSLQRQRFNRDVIETYVPIVEKAKTVGVFEIYYDITVEQQMLRVLINRSSGIMFIMAVVLLTAVVVSIIKANQYMQERARAEEELRALSLTDELTGLYNRRGFFTLAEQQIKISRRTNGVMMLASADLNGLKRINDTFGHKEAEGKLSGVGYHSANRRG